MKDVYRGGRIGQGWTHGITPQGRNAAEENLLTQRAGACMCCQRALCACGTTACAPPPPKQPTREHDKPQHLKSPSTRQLLIQRSRPRQPMKGVSACKRAKTSRAESQATAPRQHGARHKPWLERCGTPKRHPQQPVSHTSPKANRKRPPRSDGVRWTLHPGLVQQPLPLKSGEDTQYLIHTLRRPIQS